MAGSRAKRFRKLRGCVSSALTCNCSRSTQSKLIPGANDLRAVYVYFQKLFALYGRPLFVGQLSDDPATFHIDDVAGGWVSECTIDAESDPARLITEPNVTELLRRH